jgi:peptide/nickel transport system permease protein
MTHSDFPHRVTRWWKFWLPLWIVVLWLVFALFGPWMPMTPDEVVLPRILEPPGVLGGLHEWFGYDALGRPVLDRLVAGCQTSALVAAWVISVSLVLGVGIGAVSGYVGGTFDHVVVRIIDVFLAFPGILLAIALAGILGPGVDNVVLALAAVGWVGFARLTRAQTLTLKSHTHVMAARALGATPSSIIWRHVLPQINAPIIVEATFGVASAVIAEAGLSFLGLGVQPPAASWGSMLQEGTRYMLVAPHLVIVPGCAIFLVALAVNLLGDRLRDRFDVRSG